MERRLLHSVSLQKPTVWLKTYIRKVVRTLSCVKCYGRKRHQVACTFPDPVPLGQHVYIPHIWGKIMKEAIIKKLYPVSHSQYGSIPLPSVGVSKLVGLGSWSTIKGYSPGSTFVLKSSFGWLPWAATWESIHYFPSTSPHPIWVVHHPRKADLDRLELKETLVLFPPRQVSSLPSKWQLKIFPKSAVLDPFVKFSN